MTIQQLKDLKHSWTAEVQLQNNQIITIWHTALPMEERRIKSVVSVSSDYPRYTIKSK